MPLHHAPSPLPMPPHTFLSSLAPSLCSLLVSMLYLLPHPSLCSLTTPLCSLLPVLSSSSPCFTAALRAPSFLPSSTCALAAPPTPTAALSAFALGLAQPLALVHQWWLLSLQKLHVLTCLTWGPECSPSLCGSHCFWMLLHLISGKQHDAGISRPIGWSHSGEKETEPPASAISAGAPGLHDSHGWELTTFPKA